LLLRNELSLRLLLLRGQHDHGRLLLLRLRGVPGGVDVGVVLRLHGCARSFVEEWGAPTPVTVHKVKRLFENAYTTTTDVREA